jgi:hypothetical protein
VIEPVFSRNGMTPAPSFLETDEVGMPEVGAPGSLAEVTPQGAHIPNLSRTHLERSLREDTEFLSYPVRGCELAQRDGSPYSETSPFFLCNPINAADGLDVHENLRRFELRTLNSVFHQSQKIGRASNYTRFSAILT